MPAFKLIYFPEEGKGELIRSIFAHAGVKYEDVRIPFKEWSTFKPTTPFGHVPILEIDSRVTLTGCGVISRYLAERFGLAGSSYIDNLLIAGIKDFQDEILEKMVDAFFEEDETSKAEKSKELSEGKICSHLEMMGKVIKRNPAGDCWLYGPHLTYVDLNLYLLVDFMKLFMKDKFLDAYPEVKWIYAEVGAVPRIASWIKSRPERTYGPPLA